MIPVRVDRHELELDVAAELEAARADFFAHARAVGEGASVTEIITLGERLLCLLLVSDPGAYSDATVEAGEDLTFLYSALFNTRLPGGEPVDPPIANYCSVIPYTGTTEVHTVEAWTRLFWWSQLSWNGYATEAMRSIMTHPLPSALHPHRDTYREMLLTAVGDRPWVDGLMKASAAMPDDEEATAGDESVAEQVWLLERPLINMLVAAWNSDEADLARDTGAALAAHRSYWTATAERRRDPRGMFALPVAAVAAMVRRSGLTLEIESPYVPANFLSTTWFETRMRRLTGQPSQEDLANRLRTVEAAVPSLPVAASDTFAPDSSVANPVPAGDNSLDLSVGLAGRHLLEVDIDVAMVLARDDFNRRLANLEADRRFADCAESGERLLGLLLIDDPDAATAATQSVAADVSALYFLLFGTQDERLPTVRATVGGRVRSFAPTGLTDDHTIANWLRMFWWYRMTRSVEGYHAVFNSRAEENLADGSQPHLLALRAVLLKILDNREFHDELRQLAAAIADGREECASLMLMLAAIGDGDAAGFDSACAVGVHSHRNLWTSSHFQRADPRGLVALQIAGLCELALRADLDVSLDSPYLPTALLTSNWLTALATSDIGESGAAESVTFDGLDLEVPTSQGSGGPLFPLRSDDLPDRPSLTDWGLLAANKTAAHVFEDVIGTVTRVTTSLTPYPNGQCDYVYRAFVGTTPHYLVVSTLDRDERRQTRQFEGRAIEQGSSDYLGELIYEIAVFDRALGVDMTTARQDARLQYRCAVPRFHLDATWLGVAIVEGDV